MSARLLQTVRIDWPKGQDRHWIRAFHWQDRLWTVDSTAVARWNPDGSESGRWPVLSKRRVMTLHGTKAIRGGWLWPLAAPEPDRLLFLFRGDDGSRPRAIPVLFEPAREPSWTVFLPSDKKEGIIQDWGIEGLGVGAGDWQLLAHYFDTGPYHEGIGTTLAYALDPGTGLSRCAGGAPRDGLEKVAPLFAARTRDERRFLNEHGLDWRWNGRAIEIFHPWGIHRVAAPPGAKPALVYPHPGVLYREEEVCLGYRDGLLLALDFLQPERATARLWQVG